VVDKRYRGYFLIEDIKNGFLILKSALEIRCFVNWWWWSVVYGLALDNVERLLKWQLICERNLLFITKFAFDSPSPSAAVSFVFVICNSWQLDNDVAIMAKAVKQAATKSYDTLSLCYLLSVGIYQKSHFHFSLLAGR